MQRRALIPVFGAAAVSALARPAHALIMVGCGGGGGGGDDPWWGRGTVGASILARRQIVTRNDLRSLLIPGNDTFALAVEGNFARMPDRTMKKYMSTSSATELAVLAACYRSAAKNFSETPLLLDLFAVRLEATDLARLAAAFGYADVYNAVARQAPGKLGEFQMRSGAQNAGPGGLPDWFNYGNMSIPQIYNTFKTVPTVTLLGASTALWATTALVGIALYQSWNFGYNVVGTQYILPLVQTYAPSLYESVGGGINWLLNQYTLPAANLGDVEHDSAPMFQLQPISYNYFEDTGGPYNIAQEWHESYGGGGGCRASSGK